LRPPQLEGLIAHHEDEFRQGDNPIERLADVRFKKPNAIMAQPAARGSRSSPSAGGKFALADRSGAANEARPSAEQQPAVQVDRSSRVSRSSTVSSSAGYEQEASEGDAPLFDRLGTGPPAVGDAHLASAPGSK
jgi:hypothetical protein